MASSTMFATKLLVLTVAFAAMSIVWRSWPSKSHIKQRMNSTYDYIIVGAGTAGSILGDRLSEDGTASVAVLEAGSEEIHYPMVEIPLASGEMLKTKADWNYETVSQNNSCKGLVGQKSYWPRGKILGGSSSLNWMTYVRGSRHDYDEWERMGCTGWSYEDVKPYFIKSEWNRNKKYAKTDFHGNSGQMPVTDSFASHKLTNAFLRAARELGYRSVDINGADQMGVMHNQYTANWGRRISTAKAFLRPAMSRPNLDVAVNAHVIKILFKGKTAIGVQYIRNNTLYTIKAKQEVILSAGTIASAQILMLSGIGPKSHLKKLNIDVKADLPVGNNLQDHLWTDGLTYTLQEHCSITANKAKGMLSLLEFLSLGTGYLSSSGVEGTGFFRSQYQPDEDKFPHIQLTLFIMLPGNDKTRAEDTRQKFNMNRNVFETLHGSLSDREGLMLLPILLHPRSNGTIRLNSINPLEQPLIDPNYLNHMDDIKVLVDGIRLGQTMMETKAMQALGATALRRIHPACKMYTLDTDSYWQCYIRHNTMTLHHAVGTCKMGPKKDSSTVVDPELRVHGIQRLRVVDASIMPKVTSGNTMAPVMMIAEKAADMILGQSTVQRHKKHKDQTYHEEL